MAGEVATGPRTAARQGAVAAGVVAACVLVGIVVVWASVAGPAEVFTGPGPRPATGVTSSETTPATAATPSPTSQPLAPDDLEVPGWVNLVFGVVVALLAAVVVALVGWLVARAVRAWLERRREPPDVDVAFGVLDPMSAAAAAMEQDAATQAALLAEGEPRDAVIACWRRFEVQAQEAGMARERWETPAEFSVRMLETVGADPAAVAELAELFREARFSEHHLGEAERERARRALERIHAARVGRTGPSPGSVR